MAVMFFSCPCLWNFPNICTWCGHYIVIFLFLHISSYASYLLRLLVLSQPCMHSCWVKLCDAELKYVCIFYPYRLARYRSSKIAIPIGHKALSGVKRAEPGALYWTLSWRTGCKGAASDAGRQGTQEIFSFTHKWLLFVGGRISYAYHVLSEGWFMLLGVHD